MFSTSTERRLGRGVSMLLIEVRKMYTFSRKSLIVAWLSPQFIHSVHCESNTSSSSSRGGKGTKIPNPRWLDHNLLSCHAIEMNLQEVYNFSNNTFFSPHNTEYPIPIPHIANTAPKPPTTAIPTPTIPTPPVGCAPFPVANRLSTLATLIK